MQSAGITEQVSLPPENSSLYNSS